MVTTTALILAGASTGCSIFLADHIYKAWNSYKTESVKLRNGEGDFYRISDKPRKKYGLILAHTPKLRLKKNFANAAELAYKTFIYLGYDKNNIFVLEGQKKPTNRFDANNLPCNKKSLIDVLDHLSKEITLEDEFFMSVFTHGTPLPDIPFLPVHQSTIYLSKKKLDRVAEKELEEMLSDLKPKYSVLFFNSCFGGGFAKRLGKGRTIGMSVSRSDKTVYASGTSDIRKEYVPQGSRFTLAFFSALKGSFPDGKSIELPKRDLETLFDYAAKFEKEKQESLSISLLQKLAQRYGEEITEIPKKIENWFEESPWGRNTPHLVYGKINPSHLIL